MTKNVLDTVVFDLGNVLIRCDPAAAFSSVLDAAEVPAFLEEVGFAAWNQQQDAGRPWGEAVRDLSGRFPHRAEVIASYVPNFRSTLEEMPESVAVLRDLQRGAVRLLALTNWSSELFELARTGFDFLGIFEGIVVSGEEGVAKPERQLFEILLTRYHVEPSRALFVDDSLVNVETARDVGLQAVVFTSAPQLRRELEERGLLAPAVWEGDT